MLIDRQNRTWIIVTILLFVIATAIYIPYAQSQLNGPSGGTWYGLAYGIAGTACMAFAMLLSLKKRVRTMRIGRAYTWTKAHVWLGLLAYPLILYHAGFRWGQPYHLTWWLMLLFTIIVVSGIVGVFLQNVIPTKMLRELPLETIYEQIDRVTGALRAEADRIIEKACHSREEEEFTLDAIPAGAPAATLTHTTAMTKGQQVLKDFYTTDIRPFLDKRIAGGSRLMSLTSSAAAFDQVRLALPCEHYGGSCRLRRGTGSFGECRSDDDEVRRCG